ncbi:MAG: 50S ribosomal protein L29 [Nanoarchaeota archaeon]
MATLKFKDIEKMEKEEKEKKLKEFKLELIKSRGNASKSIKTKEIKKIIARILSSNKNK